MLNDFARGFVATRLVSAIGSAAENRPALVLQRAPQGYFAKVRLVVMIMLMQQQESTISS
jgi:hypothetical protein